MTVTHNYGTDYSQHLMCTERTSTVTATKRFTGNGLRYICLPNPIESGNNPTLLSFDF